MNLLMSPFEPHSRLPRFLSDLPNENVFDSVITSNNRRNWYLDWAQKCLLPGPRRDDLQRPVPPHPGGPGRGRAAGADRHGQPARLLDPPGGAVRHPADRPGPQRRGRPLPGPGRGRGPQLGGPAVAVLPQPGHLPARPGDQPELLPQLLPLRPGAAHLLPRTHGPPEAGHPGAGRGAVQDGQGGRRPQPADLHADAGDGHRRGRPEQHDALLGAADGRPTTSSGSAGRGGPPATP